MIDFTHLPDERLRITTALKGLTSPRMRRAWRNRSLVTRNDWTRCTRAAFGDLCTPNEILRIAPCLYVACSVAAYEGVFTGAAMRPIDWMYVTLNLNKYIKTTPDRALHRREFEALHPLTGVGTKGRRI